MRVRAQHPPINNKTTHLISQPALRQRRTCRPSTSARSSSTPAGTPACCYSTQAPTGCQHNADRCRHRSQRRRGRWAARTTPSSRCCWQSSTAGRTGSPPVYSRSWSCPRSAGWAGTPGRRTPAWRRQARSGQVRAQSATMQQSRGAQAATGSRGVLSACSRSHAPGCRPGSRCHSGHKSVSWGSIARHTAEN